MEVIFFKQKLSALKDGLCLCGLGKRDGLLLEGSST